MSKLIRALKIGVPLLLAVYLMYKTFEDPAKRDELFEAIGRMDLIWLFLSILCAWVSHLVRAQRWRYLLIPLGYDTRLWTRYHATMAGYLINMVLPRVGEVSRAAITSKYEKIPFDKTFGSIAAERIVDLVILGAITALTLFTQRAIIWEHVSTMMEQQDSAESNPYVFWIKVGVVLAVLIGLYLLGNSLRVKILGFLKGLLDGLLSIYHTPYKFRFIADSLLIWGLYLLMFFLPFHCMPETALMGTGAIMAAFVFGSFSVVLTPGGTGTYHFAVGLALSLYGLDLGIGQALGLAIWASQAFMLIVLGALSLLLVPRYNRNYEGHTSVPVQKTKTS